MNTGLRQRHSNALNMLAMTKVFNFNDVDNNGSLGLVAEIDGKKIIIIRRDTEIFVYINSCAHVGTPLDLQPGKFLSRDGKNIICSTHGALFEINTGYCISGPCRDQKLMALPTRIAENEIQYDSI
jgi:nitrite reductase/ring-hydroxylating ferredoxin subunit